MTPKQKIPYLIKEFKNGKYLASDFCSEFDLVIDFEEWQDDFSEEQISAIMQLYGYTSRYSPFDDEIQKYPDVYKSDFQVSEMSNLAYDILIRDNI